jgi:Flp pilus assembly protein TadG
MLKRGQRRYRHGSAVAEFAGTIFLLIMVFIAIIQAGLMMHAAVTASNAAREAARAAVTRPAGDPYGAARRAAPGFNPQVAIQRGGDSVTARVRIKTPLVFSAFGEWAPWINMSTTMRQER